MKREVQDFGKKKLGTSIIFINPSRQVLLFQRDDKPHIPYPNCWDLLGGAVETNESPGECIIREMKEEIGYDLDAPQLFKVTEFCDRVEYTYFEEVEFDVHTTPLHEGQRLRWFSKEEILALPPNAIAFGFRPVLLDFLESEPWTSTQPKFGTYTSPSMSS